ncbi:lipid II flippase MurJ, partial [Tersicoccus solisilvae]
MSRLALILIIISIMSQIIGFLRESILAFFFGATEISDAYIISVVTPGLVAGFIASGVTSTFIPAYAKLATRDRNSALNFTVTFLAFLIALGLLLCITCFIYADRIVNLMAVGFSS